jgi:prepilin-type N-terminal cleavage/methylation domain-containing protein
MRVRSGVTLLEVLIAIFIMGIGLLALLTLFPVGATTMTQAMRDARCAEAGYNARSVCFAQTIMNDANVVPLYRTAGGAAGDPTILGGDWNGPSYPVFVDAIGLNYITLVGPTLAPHFPRRSSSLAPNGPAALRWYSLHDDYTFDNNGSARNATTGVERESKYTWAYVVKQPNVLSPSVVDIYAVVYQGRNLQVAGGETQYAVASVPGPKTIIVRYNGADKPNVKRGGWVLDTTFYDPSNPALRPLAQKYGPVPANFYRVVDVTDVTVNVGATVVPAVEIELQTNLVSPQGSIPPVQTIMVLDNVAEVFSIGTGWNAGQAQ